MAPSTKTIRVHLELPEGIPEAAMESANRKARESTVLSLWESGALSTRQAAAELDLKYHDFLDLLNERGIPAVQGELDIEALEAAKRMFVQDRP